MENSVKGRNMFKYILIFFIVLLSFESASSYGDMTTVPVAQPPGPQGKIVINITGIMVVKGVVRVSLYDSDQNWSNGGLPYRQGLIKVLGPSVSYVFEQVPYRRYAIKAFHDIDNDNKLDPRTSDGPIETVGYSNNAELRSDGGNPSFNDAKFTVDSPQENLSIQLK